MRVLSIDGGGYLGLATAAFIAEAERHAKTTLHAEFELFCGTSTGAIIALALAAGMSGREIVGLYESFGDTVFKKRLDIPYYARLCPGMFKAKYALEPLRAVLNDAFHDLTLGDLFAKGKKVLVTSYSVSTGSPRIFKTDHAAQLSRHNCYRVADIALASAAAPTYFPLASLKSPIDGVTETFCDGGVVANHPALLGFAEAVYELRVAPANVKVLSISTPRADLGQPASILDLGLSGWWHRLPAIVIDSPSQISHELLRRIVASYGEAVPVYERFALKNPSRLPFDRADAACTQELLLIGTTEAASNSVRARLLPFWNHVGSDT